MIDFDPAFVMKFFFGQDGINIIFQILILAQHILGFFKGAVAAFTHDHHIQTGPFGHSQILGRRQNECAVINAASRVSTTIEIIQLHELNFQFVTDGLCGVSILTHPGGDVAALKQCEFHSLIPELLQRPCFEVVAAVGAACVPISMQYRFQVSGFGCQEVESLKPDTLYETS
jgi:hypothetical protein